MLWSISKQVFQSSQFSDASLLRSFRVLSVPENREFIPQVLLAYLPEDVAEKMLEVDPKLERLDTAA